jgi:hypothetical protein
LDDGIDNTLVALRKIDPQPTLLARQTPEFSGITHFVPPQEFLREAPEWRAAESKVRSRRAEMKMKY